MTGAELLRDVAANTQGVESSFVIPASTYQKLCDANPARYAVIFSNNSTGTILVTTSPTVQVGFGLSIAPGKIERIDAKDYAAYAQSEFFTLGVTGGTVITVVEVTLLR